MPPIENTVWLEQRFRAQGYIPEPALLTSLYLQARLARPLLLEGHAGVGKTETAKVLAQVLDTELIRLQCYEGLDANAALYEWNYQKQLLAIKLQEGDARSLADKERHIFGREYLLERPLLRAIGERDAPAVLLIDEVDRADEEFEAFLLELLSEYQVTIPEIGTVRASCVPHVLLTSNRTRELSDALKRRCLYHWIEYPDQEREREIIRARIPDIPDALARQVVGVMQSLRGLNLDKPPGVAESLDWALALLALGKSGLDAAVLEETMGCFLKSNEDFRELRANMEGILATMPGA
ncbi:MAG: MoxR family ATPase [SAR324 cluster bacterium]|nr:MoxR family ATPase [SAR324 cluster bacterium]